MGQGNKDAFYESGFCNAIKTCSIMSVEFDSEHFQSKKVNEKIS